jgi:carboxyl-terminal processing protease
MKQLLLYFWGGIVLLFTAGACHDDDDNGDDEIPAETIATNKWVKEVMEEVYYWESEIPQIDHTKESDTEAYFYKLLYKDDNWSWITDDYASLAADYSGVPVTMGYDPTFYRFSGSDQIFIVVNYVYPNSAAADAGLKRGDIILSINGTDLDIDNYYDLYSGDSYSVQLGKAERTGDGIVIGPTNRSLSMTARVTTTDPAVHHEVIDTLGYKIGYLAYVEFVSGADHVFLNSLDNIFNEFKSAGISDLIVDLRYNPGGDLDAAGHLASEIAPAAAVNAGDIVVKLQYNDLYQDYFESDPKYEDELYYRFSKLTSNINMQKVYFLTTDGTASASELVMAGLDPYMDVVLVGDSTYGKYAGAWIIPDDDEKWAVIPVTMKYTNAAGYTDFVDGLIPDKNNLIDDDLIFAVPFGDTADPMIKKAIENIAGVPQSVATRSKPDIYSRFKRLIPENKEMNLRRNLYVPAQRVTSREIND